MQWFLPDGTTPMEGDWFDTSIRSFTMRLTSNEEVDVLIVINGIDKAMDFRLPADKHVEVPVEFGGDQRR